MRVAQLLVISLLCTAQPDFAASQESTEGATLQLEETAVDEVVTVVAQRSIRDLRLEVEAVRERVYGLFNSLNSNDEFDVHCENVVSTGSRIPHRVCRPQYADNAASDAGGEFARTLQADCAGGILSEGCLATANSRAQASLGQVNGKAQEFDAEVQRLARENAEFRRAIAGFDDAKLRYDEARGRALSGLQVSASIIDGDRPGGAIPSSLIAPRNDITGPVPIEFATPEAPLSETVAGAVREGWIKLRFTVLANGTTADVRVVDSMPRDFDDLNALATAQAWTFEPATIDRAPVDWHNNLAVITARRAQTVHEGWIDFAEAYDAVAAIAATARYEEAIASNVLMQSELAATLEEMAYAEMQRAGIEHALGDPHAALDSIRLATEPAVYQLADGELALALDHRFGLEFELGLAADALATYERRAKLAIPPNPSLVTLAENLRDRLRMPDAGIVARRLIDSSGIREHRLTWPTFAVGDVDGQVDALELLCNAEKVEPRFEEDLQHSIPEGWGNCSLFIAGNPDTTFNVYEFQEPVN
jgi:TonB family protein